MTDSQSVALAPVDRRRDLMAAARALFRERGFNRTPVSAIVEGAGVSQGTFYLYFKSKSALLADLRRELFASYASTLTQVAAQDGPADARLARVVVAMADVVRDHLDLERMFRYAESGEANHRAIREGRHRLADLAGLFIREGIRDGLFAPNAAPERTAALIVGLFDTQLFDVLAFDPDALPHLLETSLRFVLAGLGTAPGRIDALVLEHLGESLAVHR